MKVRDVYDELGSPLLGFVADFSSTMHRMSPTLLRAVRRRGLDDEAVERLQAIWATDAPMRERQEEFIGYLRGRGLRSGSARIVRAPRVQHARPRAGRASGPTSCRRSCTCTPSSTTSTTRGRSRRSTTRASCASFVDGGYRGYWSSEWEGHAFAELGEVDPLLLVRRQHDLIRAFDAREGELAPASTKRSRIHACSGSRPCTGCHHSAFTSGVGTNGSATSRTPAARIARAAPSARWMSPMRSVPRDEVRQREEALDDDIRRAARCRAAGSAARPT